MNPARVILAMIGIWAGLTAGMLIIPAPWGTPLIVLSFAYGRFLWSVAPGLRGSCKHGYRHALPDGSERCLTCSTHIRIRVPGTRRAA